MGLHRASKKPDWEKVRADKRSSWQQLAGRTKGVFTPGNAISVAGLLIVVVGSALLLRQHYVAGLVTIVAGRLTDVLDGMVAEKTRTKSPLGEAVDATIDKLAILVIIPALLIEHLLPLTLLGIIILQNGLNSIVSLVAKAKHIELRPTIEGKIAMAAAWASVIAFSALKIVERTPHHFFHRPLSFVAYVSVLVFALYGVRASRNYSRLVFDTHPIDYFNMLRGRYTPHPNLLRELERIILIVNPQSSNVQRIEKRGRELARLFPDRTVTLVETTPQPADLTTKLKSELCGQPGPTLVAIGGGDGTVNQVINSLMELHVDYGLDLAQVPVLPLWGGNANDLAYMLNGIPSQISMRSMLSRGRILAIHPFEITILAKGLPKTTRFAACYASFGASAYAAAALEKPTHKEEVRSSSALGLLVKEFKQAGRAILEAPGFDAEQNGERIKIFEQVFANGARMAKLDRFPVKLHEKQFYRIVKSDKHPTLLFYGRQLLQGKKLGQITDQTFRFTTKERAWAQFDGEATILPKNTTVSIGHADTAFYAVSTKLSPGEN